MKRLSVPHLLLLLLAGILLAACAGSPPAPRVPPQPAPPAFSPLAHDPAWYLAQVAQASPGERFAWQILAARSLIAADDLQQAAVINQQLARQVFTPRQRSEQRILSATLADGQGDFASGLTLLANMDLRPLDSFAILTYYRLQGRLLHKSGDKLAAAKSLISLDDFLSEDEQQQNRQHLWTLMQGYNADTLRAYQDKPAPDKTSGWLELAALVSEWGTQPARLSQAVRQWQQAYPNHPALAMLKTPTGSETATTTVTGNYQPQHIAVFLPLSGNLAAHGDALRNGMLTGYKEGGLLAQLTFYDSAAQPVESLYQQAVKDGAQFIVGPLLKTDVDTLMALTPSVPVLALNEPDGIPNQTDRFFFSLSPTGDAEQVAQRIYADGHQTPLLVLPSGSLGQRTFDAFASQWQQLTGREPLVAWISSRQEMQANLGQALGTHGGPGKAEGEIRNSTADAIFMLASPLEATSIRSYVDYVLDPRAPRPAYYLGPKTNMVDQRADLARELNGMQLGDMPWMLGENTELRSRVAALLPQAGGELLRFYAMGYDAIHLIGQLPQLHQDHNVAMRGLTGELHVKPNGVVERRLSWAKYEDGQLVGEAAGIPAEQ